MSRVSPPASTSAVRSWCYLIWLSFQQQARVRLMVWVSLGLLALMTLLVGVTTMMVGWEVRHFRVYRRGPTYQHYLETMVQTRAVLSQDLVGSAIRDAVSAAADEGMRQSAFHIFSSGIVFAMFATFLMPLWSLTFATEGVGRERETGNLIWLLARPIGRGWVYLAKFLALLPWSLCLNLGGFAVLCFIAGRPGHLAWQLYWPAALWGTLAFCALFHLIGVWFGRPAVIAILYAFFLETLMGNMPGYLKRGSISFYMRCLMFDAAAEYDIGPTRPELYIPVSGTVAWVVLAGVTVAFLALGAVVFSRKEYLN